MNVKFYRCRRCGNLVSVLHASGVPMVCCGEPMTELVPNTVEASAEKHLPVVRQEGDRLEVNVGSADHPMVDAHFIEWVFVETAQGGQLRQLAPGAAPHASFALNGEKALAVYAYCNLHGLWKTAL